MGAAGRDPAPVAHNPIVTDEEAAIDEYASPAVRGIAGRLKARAEDFVVNELHVPAGCSATQAVDAAALRDGGEELGGGCGDAAGGDAVDEALSLMFDEPSAGDAGQWGQYVEFVLHKAGLGTVDALRELGEHVGVLAGRVIAPDSAGRRRQEP